MISSNGIPPPCTHALKRGILLLAHILSRDPGTNAAAEIYGLSLVVHTFGSLGCVGRDPDYQRLWQFRRAHSLLHIGASTPRLTSTDLNLFLPQSLGDVDEALRFEQCNTLQCLRDAFRALDGIRPVETVARVGPTCQSVLRRTGLSVSNTRVYFSW